MCRTLLRGEIKTYFGARPKDFGEKRENKVRFYIRALLAICDFKKAYDTSQSGIDTTITTEGVGPQRKRMPGTWAREPSHVCMQANRP